MYDDTRCAELDFGTFKSPFDVLELGKVRFNAEETLVIWMLRVVRGPGCDGYCIALVGESVGDCSANLGAGTEDESDWLGHGWRTRGSDGFARDGSTVRDRGKDGAVRYDFAAFFVAGARGLVSQPWIFCWASSLPRSGAAGLLSDRHVSCRHDADHQLDHGSYAAVGVLWPSAAEARIHVASRRWPSWLTEHN